MESLKLAGTSLHSGTHNYRDSVVKLGTPVRSGMPHLGAGYFMAKPDSSDSDSDTDTKRKRSPPHPNPRKKRQLYNLSYYKGLRDIYIFVIP